ncbi:MAG: hypothetical protein RLZZ337_1832 [Bacteroidota bacterium]|jgi:hypothetical protein
MRFSWLIFLLLLGSSISSLYAQTDNALVNEYIERYIENSIDQIDIQQFASDMLYFFDNPINLNKATADVLFAAPFITSFQALDILNHRKKFGDFLSLYELQVLESFTTSDIQTILPFITLSNAVIPFDMKDVFHNGSHQFMSLAETNRPKNKGTLIADTLAVDRSASHYAGSPIYNNLRYRFDYKRYISMGINAEKDAGESFFSGNNPKGYDYYSFYFEAKNLGKLKTLHLGDFQANFGQGLTLSTGLAFGKSSIITNSKRNFSGFGAYRSLRENAYLRGGAIAFQVKNIELGAFVSSKNIDGNAVETTDTIDNEPDITTTIQEDGGLHRTPNEIVDKHIIHDFQTGSYAVLKLPFGKIGAVHYTRKLGRAFIPTDRPDNAFSFSGSQYSKTGTYYDFAIKNINIYGEVSYSSFENAIAQVHGALIGLSKNADFSVVYRNYDKSFITLQSNGFGENSKAANENGFYVGFMLRPSKQISVLGYYDLFKSPWLRFQADALSSGEDIWAEINYKPSRSFSAYYRYRNEQKQININGEKINKLASYSLTRHRIHMSYSLSRSIELRNRIEWNSYTLNRETSLGSFIYQDIVYKPLFAKVECSGRIAYAQIERFANRIYAFEQVPLYDYPLYTYGFSGARVFLLTRFRPTSELDIWFRYAISRHDVPLNTLRTPTYSIGSGLDETMGNNRQTFTLQVRYKIK